MSCRRFFLLLILPILLIAACQSEEAGTTYEVRGVYVGPQFDGDAAIIDHEAIPGYMEAMRMPFRVEDPALLTDLEPDTPVSFRLVVKDDGAVIEEIERLPEGTMLQLADAPAETMPADSTTAMPADTAAAAL